MKLLHDLTLYKADFPLELDMIEAYPVIRDGTLNSGPRTLIAAPIPVAVFSLVCSSSLSTALSIRPKPH